MLYFVATPIGNLKDISHRAIEVLNQVDVIACEDTRKSMILLNHYEIKKRLISYHKNNEYNSAKGIVELLNSGKDVAVISDSGMPVISDPGSVLIEKLKENGLEYTIIPGANAGLSALVLSGFDASKFTFLGFLPEKNKVRNDILNSVKNYETTLIFYLSPHNVKKDLETMFTHLGAREVCLVGEITKIHEKKLFFNLAEIPEFEARGEYVLVVEGGKKRDEMSSLSISEQVEFYIQSGLTKKEALKQVAKENKIKNIYSILRQE